MIPAWIGSVAEMSVEQLREQELAVRRQRRRLSRAAAKVKVCVCGEPDCIGEGLIVQKFFDYTLAPCDCGELDCTPETHPGDLANLDQEMEAQHLVPCIVIGCGKRTMLVESSEGRLICITRMEHDTRSFKKSDSGWLYSFATEESAVLESFFIPEEGAPAYLRSRLLAHKAANKGRRSESMTTTRFYVEEDDVLSTAPEPLFEEAHA